MEYLIMINKYIYNIFLNQTATEYRKQFSKKFSNNGNIQIYMSIIMSRVTAHSKTTHVTSLTLRVTTASLNYWMLFNTFQNMLLNARYNVNGDEPVHIDWLNERRLVGFARDGPSPCLSRGPGHSTGALSVNDQMGLKMHFRFRNITINTITINIKKNLTFLNC